MKNPLRKRLLRELVSEFGKYLVIFLFMAVTIGFVSGFLVAGDSMILMRVLKNIRLKTDILKCRMN